MIKNFVGELLLDTGRERIKGTSRGQMHIPTGELLVEHEYAKAPKTFNLDFLPVGALTGTPEPERAIGAVVNPFRPASEYYFRRKIRFDGQRSLLIATGHYVDDGNGGRRGTLEFHGQIPTMQKVVKVEPTTEIWVPGGKLGQIFGSFSMSFMLEDGSRIVAHTNTNYEVTNSPLASKFVNPHFRFITLQHSTNGAQFKQEEQISLFQAPTEHVNQIKKLKRIIV